MTITYKHIDIGTSRYSGSVTTHYIPYYRNGTHEHENSQTTVNIHMIDVSIYPMHRLRVSMGVVFLYTGTVLYAIGIRV